MIHFQPTLFVTVLANFRMFELLPWSHRRSAYISRILLPSSRFVSVVDTTSLPSKNTLTVGRRGPLEIEVDRPENVPLLPMGVRDPEVGGLWYAYVMKRESDRKTSGVMLLFTRLSKAWIK